MKINPFLYQPWYFIQGWYSSFISKEYNRIFTDDKIDEIMYKAASCPNCVFNGTCIKCGCNTKALMLSDKPCEKYDSSSITS